MHATSHHSSDSGYTFEQELVEMRLEVWPNLVSGKALHIPSRPAKSFDYWICRLSIIDV